MNLLTWLARPNEVMVARGTGLGPVSFDETLGAPSYRPGLEGCSVPVAVKVGGVVSNFVTVS